LNNSLGCWLRPERGPVTCPACQNHMYMATWCQIPAQNMQVNGFPFSLFVCPNCGRQDFRAHNI
jgi:predicted nucleic-acid-binding Zn-ribbon protein